MALLPLLAGVLLTASPEAAAAQTTVPALDVDRYLGTWFEIASFPAFFQRGCVGSTATYTKNDDGTLKVRNRCRDKTLDGPVKTANGKAWIPDPKEPGKLKVQFFWPFKGDYWILELAEDYSHVVIGSPSRDYCWILSRKPTMDDALYAQLVERLKARGYDVSKLKKTPQPAAPSAM